MNSNPSTNSQSGGGLSPPTGTPNDTSLTVGRFAIRLIAQKVKEAAPFVPQSVKKSLTSQASPFTPTVAAPAVLDVGCGDGVDADVFAVAG